MNQNRIVFVIYVGDNLSYFSEITDNELLYLKAFKKLLILDILHCF
jgi:hypothetical protein